MVRGTRAARAALIVTLAVAPALAQHAELEPRLAASAPSAPPAPLRQRTGVVVVDPQVGGMYGPDQEHKDGALAPRELRLLSLRSESLGLTDLTRWPPEPASPSHVEPARLSAALRQLCPPTVPAAALAAIAAQIVRASEHFGVDPMLLGALVYHQSSCDASRRNSWGAGLAMLNRGLLPPSLARGELSYAFHDARGTKLHERLNVGVPLAAEREALLDPTTNLRIAAALLRMFRDQCPDLDAHFASTPHRHFVSHFIWGDRVRGTAPEDGVLLARRRLLRYYREDGNARERTAALGPLTLASPLDGAPRIVTSGLGEAREGGRRAHAGVDFLSRAGEPVRAVADGVVSRAGTDLADGTLIDVAPDRTALVPERAMGVRGLFVEIAHVDSFRSIYAHLASYRVVPGMSVARGDLIGYVGRSGVRESDPHLHFGLFQGAQVIDPRKALASLLFAPLLELRDARERRARGTP